MTDGLENASREWTRPAIKALIEHQSRGYSWQFLYLGADQDAVEVGTGMGIPADRALTYSRGNSRVAMAAGAAMVSGLRSPKASGQPFAHIGFSDSDRTAATGRVRGQRLTVDACAYPANGRDCGCKRSPAPTRSSSA